MNKIKMEILPNDDFPIVGIGASAGGLKEFEVFLSNFSPEFPISLILVQHLDPTSESNLRNILRNYTSFNIYQAENDIKIKKNTIYIIPPNKKILVKNKKIFIEDFDVDKVKRLTIDYLFRSLAEDLKEKSIGILLSGTGTDGTLGLRKIKGEGGMAMVQDPDTTRYNGMLESAINNIVVDYILPTEIMPEKLIEYIKTIYGKLEKHREFSEKNIQEPLDKIFDIIRSYMGHEFSAYKNTTILRRIERRMTVNQINSLDNYIKYLIVNEDEIYKLSHELLIGVTGFFRDQETFGAFEKKVVPQLTQNREKKDSIRIWVPACSTGEEAYTLTILFHRFAEKQKEKLNLQIFATDIDANSIAIARKGVYKDNIIADVPADILNDFFIRENGNFKVIKKIRNSIVFAIQNVITDPPFSNMDLISCRNLLIYLKPTIQKKLLNLFHYSLNPNGFLLLGNSESLGGSSRLYKEFDRRNKIFQTRLAINSYSDNFGTRFPLFASFKDTPIQTQKSFQKKKQNYQEIMEDNLLNNYVPPSLLVNGDNQIIYIHGKMGEFLEPSTGEPSNNINNLVREDIRLEVTTALRRCQEKKKGIEFKNIRFSINDKELIFNLRVQPALDIENGEDLYLMFFEHGSIKSEGITYNSSSGENLRNVDEIRTEQLEHELKSTRSQLNTTIEECETINEELKSTNEEYLSANEELKSTNEELQTSKEEFQSINEELVTVNNELEAKIDELSNTNDDLRNLIQSTEIGTLFLDKDLKIRKFTESINKIFSIIETDEGRPLRDISSNLKNINIIEEAKKVLDNFIPIEKDVQIENELWYRLRINPYRTESKFIDGVVLTFMDITERKKIEQSLRKSETKFRDAFNQLKFYEDLFTHDMRNILQVISSSMELSIDKYENQTEEESKIILDSLHRTQNQVNRGHKLIDNVQKLSIIENSLENVYTRDLTSVIESAKKYIEDAFKNENVTFKISAYKQGIPVRASNLLEDVLENLMINGIKYNDSSRKKLWIRVSKTSKNDTDYARIEVADNGRGISDELKKRLFYERIKEPTKGGMGIGLTIVKKVIEMLNGDIWVEDRYQNNKVQGTRFVILIPLAE